MLEAAPLKEGFSNCSILFWGQQEDVGLLKKETGQDSFFQEKDVEFKQWKRD